MCLRGQRGKRTRGRSIRILLLLFAHIHSGPRTTTESTFNDTMRRSLLHASGRKKSAANISRAKLFHLCLAKT